jgi:hypothetical protein
MPLISFMRATLHAYLKLLYFIIITTLCEDKKIVKRSEILLANEEMVKLAHEMAPQSMQCAD